MNLYIHLVHRLCSKMKRNHIARPKDIKQTCFSLPQQIPVLSHVPIPPHFHNFQRWSAAQLYPFAASPYSAPLPHFVPPLQAPEPLSVHALWVSRDESGLNAEPLRRNRSESFISILFTAYYKHVKTYTICPIKTTSLRRKRTPFTT